MTRIHATRFSEDAVNLGRRLFTQTASATAASLFTAMPSALANNLATKSNDLATLSTKASLYNPSTRSLYTPQASTKVTGSLPPFAVRVLAKMGFGPRQGDIEWFNGLAGNDNDRLDVYINQQLSPTAIDDSELEVKLAQADFFTLQKSLAQLWADHFKNHDDWQARMRPLFETERAAFLRAVYSRRQLVEVLTDFWHNHFNVHGLKYEVGPVFVHYDREVIRPQVLGNFRTMLAAVAKSAAMMYYLDNVYNSAEGPNENYARELLELHTLGAVNSYGFADASAVPGYADGLKQGYTEADVKTLARCLTGWTIHNGWPWPLHPQDQDNGSFFFRSEWHDYSTKRLLGLTITESGIGAAEQVFDWLARHPNVARFVCEKLCRRFISDNPPTSVVDEAAIVFQQQHQADDQLAQVMQVILRSEAFKTTWGEKIKRPFEIICSALRACDADISLRFDDVSRNWNDNGFWFDSDSFLWQATLTGQRLFDWAPPNGYPDYREDWASSTPLIMSLDLINSMINHWGSAANVHRIDVIGQTWHGLPNVADHSPEKLADFWLLRLLGYMPAVSQREFIVQFMAQDGDRHTALDITEDIWSEQDIDAYVPARLRMMVAIILMMPEFMLR